ncbi:MAG: NAD(P)-binding domain-containing protein [Maribacter sp.]
MNKSLRFISISHKKASIAQREEFHIQEAERSDLVTAIGNTFSDISGLLLLVTCNRTEIYFESQSTSATKMRDFLVGQKAGEVGAETKQFFNYSNKTEDTVQHLLKVTSGLASSVLGDAEIVHQIKKSYQFSIAHQLQGSLLERAMQTVFKSHKRISNETHFRDGTTSVAYKSLKVVANTFDKTSSKTKKILFIGAGDIVNQLFKYNSKFKFNNIYVSNRTAEKARAFSKLYQSKVFSWDRVLTNDFQDFDVIISAASNFPQLIKQVTNRDEKVLLIDLAIPCNIDKTLGQKENIMFYDLDAISVDLEETKEKRFEAIGEVTKILTEELDGYKEWLQEAPLRAFLAEYKIIVNQKVVQYFDANALELNEQHVKTITDRVVRKLRKKTLRPISLKEMEDVIAEQGVFFSE